MLNRHNEDVWYIETPHEHQGRRPKARFRIKVSFGLLGDTIFGLYIYEENLTADGHLQFLRTYILIISIRKFPFTV